MFQGKAGRGLWSTGFWPPEPAIGNRSCRSGVAFPTGLCTIPTITFRPPFRDSMLRGNYANPILPDASKGLGVVSRPGNPVTNVAGAMAGHSATTVVTRLSAQQRST